MRVPRDLSPKVAERGAQQDSRSGHMKIYMAGMIASSEPESSFGSDILFAAYREALIFRAVGRIHGRMSI